MSRYDPSIQTVRPAEVVAWATGVLRECAALRDSHAPVEKVYEHEEPAETPDCYGVVMQERPAGGSRATVTGVRAVTLIVRFECPVNLPNWSVWHDEMRDRAEEVLMSKAPAVESAGRPGVVRRLDENDVPMIDASGDRTRYSTCAFRVAFESSRQPA